MSDVRLLNTKELSERLNVAVGTLENWRQRGKGPKFVKQGKARNADVRYRIQDVLEFEKNNP